MNGDMYLGKKKDNKFRYWKQVIDLITIILGAVTVFIGIYVAFMVNERLKWLPVLFLLAALVNLIEALKKMYYGGEIAKGIAYFVWALAIAVFSVVTYIVIWQRGL